LSLAATFVRFVSGLITASAFDTQILAHLLACQAAAADGMCLLAVAGGIAAGRGLILAHDYKDFVPQAAKVRD
jgi:hypothetical protein